MIKVNGKDLQWQPDMTVKDVLIMKKFTYPKIIVKINGELINKEEYESKTIMDEDDIQVIHLLAGG